MTSTRSAAASALTNLDTALDRLEEIAIPLLASEQIPVNDAAARILSADIVSPIDLPLFDNSAMDGFALLSTDAVAGARLRIVGSSYAGYPHRDELQPATAIRIATGGMLPSGADCVAMLEVCDDSGTDILLRNDLTAGTNCRRAGQDVRAGAAVLQRGTRLSAPALAMNAALGLETVPVYRRLRVAVASTGSELIERGTPKPGQVYDCNRTLLQSALHPYGVDFTDLGILADDPMLTLDALVEASRSADLIITSGGVSVGERDYVRDTVMAEGRVLFWRLAVKPGKPLLLGSIGDTPLIGLPGNPVSVFVTFQLVCRPLLRHLQGLAPSVPRRFPVHLGKSYSKSSALREFIRVTLHDEGGEQIALPFRSQLSNLVSSLLESDGLLDLPQGKDFLSAGEILDFLPWTSFVA